MPRIFWPNFDFEHELAIGESWRTPLKLLELNEQFATRWLSVASAGDVIALPVSSETHLEQGVRFIPQSELSNDEEFESGEWQLIPWGVTPSLEKLAARLSWIWNQPECELVRSLNDRATSFAWEEKTGSLPQGVSKFSTVAELERILASQSGPWVIKARFGMSARERILGEDQRLTEQQLGWINKRLKEQQTLFFEPWLERIQEVGIQLHVPQAGEVQILGVLPLVSNRQGEYIENGSPLSPAECEMWQGAIEIARIIGQDFGRQGYFGPLGIDAMTYLAGDELSLRPVQDINARWTMGRLTWEAGRKRIAKSPTP